MKVNQDSVGDNKRKTRRENIIIEMSFRCSADIIFHSYAVLPFQTPPSEKAGELNCKIFKPH